MLRSAVLGIHIVLLLLGAVSAQPSPHSPASGKPALPPQLKPQGGRWEVALGPSLWNAGSFQKLPLPDMAFEGERPLSAALAPSGDKTVVIYLDKPLGSATKTRMLLCDLGQGRVAQQWWLPSVLYPLALDSSGTRVLARSHGSKDGTQDKLELIVAAADGKLTQHRWAPYRDEPEKTRDILWAEFAGTQRLVTLSEGGKLTVWDAATLKPLCWVSVFPATPAVSPNGRYVAFLGRDAQVGLLDPTAGRILGQMPLGVAVSEAALAFRPDGRALVCAAKDMAILLDIPTGRVELGIVPGITGQPKRHAPSVGWVEDRLLVVNNFLVDPVVPYPLWKYTGTEWSHPCQGQLWCLTHVGLKKVALVAQPVPTPRVRDQLAKFKTGTPTWLLRPGDAIQVDVATLPKENQLQVKQVLEKRLVESGFRPAIQAGIRLEALILQDGHRETAFTASGTRGEKVRTRYLVAGVRLIREGKDIWRGAEELTTGPGMLAYVPQGQTVASTMAGYSIPDYAKLGKLHFPRFLLSEADKHARRGPLGYTHVHMDRNE